MTERTEDLLDRLSNTQPARREELTARAVEAGHSREYADLIYDVALEEHVDPAVALELVLAGVGVRELGGTAPEHWEETQVEAPPQWIGQPPSQEQALREKHMRLTFRRLRSMVEEHGALGPALHAFMRAPDVGDVEY